MKRQRSSRQRQMILDAVMSRSDHPTADQIYMDVRARDEKVSRGTVYRNLGILSEDGEITEVKVPAANRYDFRQRLHYHLFCTSCEKVFDAPLDYESKYDAEMEQKTGFKISRHRVIFEGLCPACAEKKEKSNEETEG